MGFLYSSCKGFPGTRAVPLSLALKLCVKPGPKKTWCLLGHPVSLPMVSGSRQAETHPILFSVVCLTGMVMWHWG